MRAKLFFETLNHGRKIYARENNLRMAELCDVAVVAANSDNHKAFRKQFLDRAFGVKKPPAMNPKDPKTANIVAAAFHAAQPHYPRARTIKGGRRGR